MKTIAYVFTTPKARPDDSARVADAALPDGRHDPQRLMQPDDIPTGSATRVFFLSHTSLADHLHVHHS
jgi:hypothetical protein